MILTMLASFALGYGIGLFVGMHQCRREIRRLQDVIMALDDSADEAAWLKRFGRKR